MTMTRYLLSIVLLAATASGQELPLFTALLHDSDNLKGISKLRFWNKKRNINGISDLPVFMQQRRSDARTLTAIGRRLLLLELHPPLECLL